MRDGKNLTGSIPQKGAKDWPIYPSCRALNASGQVDHWRAFDPTICRARRSLTRLQHEPFFGIMFHYSVFHIDDRQYIILRAGCQAFSCPASPILCIRLASHNATIVIAASGQVLAQSPQPQHFSWSSFTNLATTPCTLWGVSSRQSAPKGHRPMHRPQWVH